MEENINKTQQKVCPNCGANVKEDDITCPYCGFPLLDKRKIILLDKEISDLEYNFNELKELIPRSFYQFFMPLAIGFFLSFYLLVCINLNIILGGNLICNDFLYVSAILIFIFFLFIPEQGIIFYINFFKKKKIFAEQVEIFSKKYAKNSDIKNIINKYENEIINNRSVKLNFIFAVVLTIFLFFIVILTGGITILKNKNQITVYPKKYEELMDSETECYLKEGDSLIIMDDYINLEFDKETISTTLSVHINHPEAYKGCVFTVFLRFYSAGKDLIPIKEYLQPHGLEGIFVPNDTEKTYVVHFSYWVSVLYPARQIYLDIDNHRDNIKLLVVIRITKNEY